MKRLVLLVSLVSLSGCEARYTIGQLNYAWMEGYYTAVRECPKPTPTATPITRY